MISKFIEAFVLPPGLFFVLLLALGLWLWFARKDRLSAGLGFALAAVIYLFSMDAVGELLIRPLERAYPAPEAATLCRADAVVVLGGGGVSSSPAEGGAPALGPESTGRVSYGVRLARNVPLPLVVTGGRPIGREELPSWAESAARVARDLGIEGERLILEDESRTTWENARFVAEDLGVERPVVVTSAWHMPRSVYTFRRNGMEPIPAPTVFRHDPAAPSAIDFFPSAGGFETSATALHEYVGLLYYRLRY